MFGDVIRPRESNGGTRRTCAIAEADSAITNRLRGRRLPHSVRNHSIPTRRARAALLLIIQHLTHTQSLRLLI